MARCFLGCCVLFAKGDVLATLWGGDEFICCLQNRVPTSIRWEFLVGLVEGWGCGLYCTLFMGVTIWRRRIKARKFMLR